MAKPYKLTPQTKKRILTAIRLGSPLEYAAEFGGINRGTLREWMNRGEEGEAPYAAFLGDVQKAQADAVAVLLKRINDAAKSGDWKAAAWILERRHREHFGRNVEVSGLQGGAIDLRLVNPPDDETLAFLVED